MRIRTVRLALPAFMGLLAAATACGSSSASDAGTTGGTRLKVVATTTQVADFARNVGGDKVKVTQILKPNVDPHDYEPSPADVQAIAEADVVVESGVHLEKWLDQTIESAGFHGTLVDSSQGVAVRQGNGTDEEAAGDPHIWHNPQNAEVMVADIAAALRGHGRRRQARPSRANLDRLHGQARPARRRIAAADRHDPRRPSASWSPTTTRSATTSTATGCTFVGSIIPSFDTSAELSGAAARPTSSPRSRRPASRRSSPSPRCRPRPPRRSAAQAGVKWSRRRGLAVRRQPRPGRLGRRDLPRRGAAQHHTPSSTALGGLIVDDPRTATCDDVSVALRRAPRPGRHRRHGRPRRGRRPDRPERRRQVDADQGRCSASCRWRRAGSSVLGTHAGPGPARRRVRPAGRHARRRSSRSRSARSC